MYAQRKPLMQQLEAAFGFKAILYVTGDRPANAGISLQSQIQEDVLPLFLDHLDALGKVDHLGLILYSRGGNIITGWSIVNLLRQFCNKLTVIVPFRAQSTATLICLGADEIIMTKQATLGPIDPSTNGSFNPIPAGSQQPVPLSVEDLSAYLEMAKGLKLGANGMTQVMMKLSDNVNPIAIGTVQRIRGQIRQLADKLLQHSSTDLRARKKIISVLCEDAGSHDYTIYRTEAAALGLKVKTPDAAQYSIIKALYDDFEAELQLRSTFIVTPPLPGQTTSHHVVQGLLETPGFKSHAYECDFAIMTPQNPQPGQFQIQPTFQGWR